MPDRVPHAQRTRPLVVEQDCKELVGNYFLYDLTDIIQEAIKIERFRCNTADFEKEIEQFRPLAEADFGFARGGHQYGFASPAGAAEVSTNPDSSSRIIETLALAPIRFAPAATICRSC